MWPLKVNEHLYLVRPYHGRDIDRINTEWQLPIYVFKAGCKGGSPGGDPFFVCGCESMAVYMDVLRACDFSTTTFAGTHKRGVSLQPSLYHACISNVLVCPLPPLPQSFPRPSHSACTRGPLRCCRRSSQHTGLASPTCPW